jgi:acetyl-CoA carboxylase/biotin carboxylase 1
MLSFTRFIDHVLSVAARYALIPTVDPINRPITFTPTKQPYDPRHMLSGVKVGDEWQSGFFDRDSFIETLSGWGKTVVCGRASLGGIPIGVIAVETRTVERIIPADPAIVSSHETLIQQVQLTSSNFIW